MKFTCLHCEHEFEGSASLDRLGWHTLCPECGCSFDVDLPTMGELRRTIMKDHHGDVMYFYYDEDIDETYEFPHDPATLRDDTVVLEWMFTENGDGEEDDLFIILPIDLYGEKTEQFP